MRKICSIQKSSGQLVSSQCPCQRCRFGHPRTSPSTNYNINGPHSQYKLSRRSQSLTYIELLCVTLVSGVEFLHVVLSVLDDDLVRLAVKAENDDDVVPLPVFHPPRCELEALNLICSKGQWQCAR